MKLKKLLLGSLSTITVVAPIVATVSCSADTETKNTFVAQTAFENNFKAEAATEVQYKVGATPATISAINGHAITTHTKTASVDISTYLTSASTLQDVINLIADIGTGDTTSITFEGTTASLANYESNQAAKDLMSKFITFLTKTFPNSLIGVPAGAIDIGIIDFADNMTAAMPGKGEFFTAPTNLPNAPEHTRWVAACAKMFIDASGIATFHNIESFKRPYLNFTLGKDPEQVDPGFAGNTVDDAANAMPDLKFTFKLEALPGFKIVGDDVTYTVVYTSTATPAPAA